MARMIRLKDLLPFGKAKTPGFGIGKRFYMSVLANTAALPPLLAIISPKGDAGSVPGFGVPMRKDADKADIARPLVRGFYGLASPDQKTVLRLTVVSRDEAGFDPTPVLMSSLGQALPADVRARIAATWNLLQVTFESHDPMVYPALDFLLQLCQRMGDLTDGVVADPICQVYRLPHQIPSPFDEGLPFAVRDHVHVHTAVDGAAFRQHTLGLSKFNLPEIEARGIQEPALEAGAAFLYSLSQMALSGAKLAAGQKVEDFVLRPGGQDKGLWEGIPCLEAAPQKAGAATSALLAWGAEHDIS